MLFRSPALSLNGKGKERRISSNEVTQEPDEVEDLRKRRKATEGAEEMKKEMVFTAVQKGYREP